MQFSEVKGQEFLVGKLKAIIDNHHFPHAVLIDGKDGYGAMALALAIAQYISCENKQEDSCGECPSCKKYQKIIHPDLHLVFPTATTEKITSNPTASLFISQFRDFLLETKGYADLNSWLEFFGAENKQGSIYVRDAEELLASINMTAYESKYKIVIIWHADRLNEQTSNKLLKILEEPYPNTIFILTAERKEKILPTILSRVQQIQLSPLSDDIIAEEISKAKPHLSEQEVRRDAILCEGDMTKMNDANTEAAEKHRELFIKINRLALTYKKNAGEIIKFTDDISKLSRENLKSFIAFYLTTIEKIWLYNNNVSMPQHPLETMDEKFKDNFPKFITINNLEGICTLMEKAQHNVDRNANAKINIFNLIIKLGMLLEKR